MSMSPMDTTDFVDWFLSQPRIATQFYTETISSSVIQVIVSYGSHKSSMSSLQSNDKRRAQTKVRCVM